MNIAYKDDINTDIQVQCRVICLREVKLLSWMDTECELFTSSRSRAWKSRFVIGPLNICESYLFCSCTWQLIKSSINSHASKIYMYIRYGANTCYTQAVTWHEAWFILKCLTDLLWRKLQQSCKMQTVFLYFLYQI